MRVAKLFGMGKVTGAAAGRDFLRHRNHAPRRSVGRTIIPLYGFPRSGSSVRAKPRYPLPGFLRFSVARLLPPYLYRDSHKPFSIACAVRSRRKNAGAEPVAAPARVRVANPRQGDFAKPDCVVELRASGRTRLRTTESRSKNSVASRKLSSSHRCRRS